MRELVEQQPLLLGLMFPQGQGVWTASLVSSETCIQWHYLESLARLADKILPLLKTAGLRLENAPQAHLEKEDSV